MSAAVPQPAANPLRGETELALGAARYRLRPSFTALAAIEAETGSFFALVERAAAGAPTLSDVLAVLWHLADPKPDGLTRERFNALVIEAGLAAAAPVFRQALERALTGAPA
jgi:hypothetical protein